MNKLLILIILSFIIFSCDSADEEVKIKQPAFNKEQLSKFIGQYYLAQINSETNKIELQENCWTKALEAFEISEFAGSPGSFYFDFNGYRNSMYEMDSCYLNEDGSLFITGTLDDGSIEGLSSFQIKNIRENVFELTPEGSSQIILVRQENKDKYTYVPCIEEVSEERELAGIDLMFEIFNVFFTLRDSSNTISTLIPQEGILFIAPGDGLYPIKQTLTTKEDVLNTEIFNTKVFERLVEYMEMHNNEERSFLVYVDEESPFPDRCNPQEEALFVNLGYNNDRLLVGATVMLTKYNDEKNEAYTYLMMELKFIDNHFKIISIDTQDCSA